jgi:hypothetical protein
VAPSDRIAPVTRRVPIRWRIFGFLFAIGFLEYLQQRGLTIAAERMMPELHFTQLQIGWIEQSFVIGYALHLLPAVGRALELPRHRPGVGGEHRRHRRRA